MDNLTTEQIAANEKIVADKLIEDNKAAELKKQSKTEALRELSKEFNIDAFKPEEIKKKFSEFTQWQTDQKSEQEVLQDKYNLLDKEKTEWQSKKLDYEIKIEASKHGIADEYIADAMKIAGGDPTKLVDVIKKYPVFKSKTGITIGVNNQNNNNILTGRTETEAYMAKNPIYKGYQK